jgi:hypothetical protein
MIEKDPKLNTLYVTRYKLKGTKDIITVYFMIRTLKNENGKIDIDILPNRLPKHPDEIPTVVRDEIDLVGIKYEEVTDPKLKWEVGLRGLL